MERYALRKLEALLAMVGGLAAGILVGTYEVTEAVELVDYRLDRIFTSARSDR